MYFQLSTAFPAIQPLESLVPGKHNHVSFFLPREEAESGLEFLGLLVMENRLKPETKPVLRELAAARIRSIMVTGEPPTAMADGSSSLLQQPHDGGHGANLSGTIGRGQPSDSSHGGQECRYDSRGQQSHHR